jgi:hypothetical protein
MSVDSEGRDLLVRGITAAKAKEAGEARFFLKWLLRLDPPAEERIEALYWLSEICTDPAEQRGYLEDILANDQGEPRARRNLKAWMERNPPSGRLKSHPGRGCTYRYGRSASMGK